MATRSAIIIKDNEHYVTYYKHWDGYCSDTLPKLLDVGNMAISYYSSEDINVSAENFGNVLSMRNVEFDFAGNIK